MQEWYGGPAGEVWPDQDNFQSPDMTAISVMHAPPGFVVAADGRCGGYSDEEQKIFRANYKGTDVAYAITGLAYNADRSVNVLECARKASENWSIVHFQPLEDCMGVFGQSIKDFYAGAQARGLVRFDDPVVARLFIVGYFRKRRPSRIIVTISHADQTLLEPTVEIKTPPGEHLYSGCPPMVKAIRSDPRFRHYFHPANQTSSLEQMIAAAKGFVGACCDPLAVTVDPQCNGIGGHIHVAILTLSGFRWIIPPK
jgi:hypothetical protein